MPADLHVAKARSGGDRLELVAMEASSNAERGVVAVHVGGGEEAAQRPYAQVRERVTMQVVDQHA